MTCSGLNRICSLRENEQKTPKFAQETQAVCNGAFFRGESHHGPVDTVYGHFLRGGGGMTTPCFPRVAGNRKKTAENTFPEAHPRHPLVHPKESGMTHPVRQRRTPPRLCLAQARYGYILVASAKQNSRYFLAPSWRTARSAH